MAPRAMASAGAASVPGAGEGGGAGPPAARSVDEGRRVLRCDGTRLPLRVNINATRRCNLACWYCHSSSGPNYRGPELTAEAMRSVLQGAEELGAFEVTLTGGEPLLWRGLAEGMAAAGACLEWAKLEVITNALVLTPRRLEALAGAGLARVCVSLDSAPELHEATRGPGSFAATIDGIARLRQVVDNVTVISVLDRGNAARWPELTERLVGLGVRQHHLAPVCFAGHAMDDYRGLSAEQFAATRARVDAVAGELPEGFTLRFNDGLVHPPTGRRISISSLVEVQKGLHAQVMPDGDVRSAVRVWGRTWRAPESLGNVNERPFAEVIQASAGRRAANYDARFGAADELRRKFHLDADPASIHEDATQARDVEAGVPVAITAPGPPPASFVDPARLARDQAGLDGLMASARRPGRGRLRIDPDVAFYFDTETFEVWVLTVDEARALAADRRAQATVREVA